MKLKISAMLLLLYIYVSAQINGSRFELSFSGTFSEMKSTYESSSRTYSYTSEGEFHYYFLSTIRCGYLLNNNFEVEPELQILLVEDIDPSYSINANLLYNIDTDSSKVKPFLLLGYGIGNTVPVFGSLYPITTFESKSLSVHQFNAGAGLRIMITDKIAIRTEYRYQQYKYNKEYSNVYSTSKYTFHFHNLLFGVSFYL